MKSVEAVASVSPEGTLTAHVPPEIEPGEHKVMILIEESQKTTKKRPPLDFPVPILVRGRKGCR